MANAKVTVDGRDITADVGNIDDFVLYVKLNEETKVVGEELSDNLIITGESAKWLSQIFFENCENYDTILPATFYSPICDGITLDLYLTGENIVNDPCGCKLKVPFKSFSKDQCCAQELDATEWYSDGFCEQYTFPLVWYANQPSFLQYILLKLRQFIIALATIIAVGLTAGLTIGTGLAITVAAAAIIRLFFLEDIDTWLTGTGRLLPAPLCRDIFEYQTQKCGLGFSSSIWQDPSSPYHNEAIIYSEAGEYLRPSDVNNQDLICSVFLANAANISTLELLGMYAEKFNAKYEIINGVLHFEHESYFENQDSEVVINLVELCERGLYDDENGEEPPKYEYNDQELWAGLRIAYTKDNFDSEGNKTIKIGIYKNNYGFSLNQDSDLCKYNPNQFDIKRVNIEFGAIRGMFDVDIKPSLIDLGIDHFRNGDTTTVSRLLGSNNHSEFNDRECDLVMTSDMTFYPKTVILEDGFDFLDARIKKREATAKELEDHMLDNPDPRIQELYAYKYNEDNQVTALFDNFHYSSDPSVRSGKLIISNVDVPCDCALMRAILQEKTRTGIMTHYGKGKISEFAIKFDRLDSRITLSDIVVYCGSN